MCRVFEHSQVVLSGFQCMYAIREASLQSRELYCDDPNRLLLWLGRRQLQLDDQSVFRLRVKNPQNEIRQTNFDTAILLRLRRLKTAPNFLLSLRCNVFPFAKIKKQNMTIMFILIFHFSTKTTQPIKKLFLPIDSWIANYQITKCILHYVSKPKNSTEAFIYERNPQLLSCQPNTITEI